jgi:hypothetical protein
MWHKYMKEQRCLKTFAFHFDTHTHTHKDSDMSSFELNFLSSYMEFLFGLLTQTLVGGLAFGAVVFLMSAAWKRRAHARAARKAEHNRLEALPPLHLLTARSVINLWGVGSPVAHNAARVLAAQAGWRLSDVTEVMCGRHGLTPDELSSIWASRVRDIMPLLNADMSDAEYQEALRPLFHGVDGVDGHRVRSTTEKKGHKDVGVYPTVQGPK